MRRSFSRRDHVRVVCSRSASFRSSARCPSRRLRHYDDLGLLAPASVDRFTSYRYYTADQLPRLNRILALKDLGLSLEEIRRLLAEGLPAAELRGMLRIKQAELERHLAEEQARLGRVAARLSKSKRRMRCLPTR